MQKAELRKNRAGVKWSPLDAEKMKKILERDRGAQVSRGERIQARGEHVGAEDVRDARLVGPSSRCVTHTGIQAPTGKRVQMLVDRLQERLAFEHTGTRLYEAMLVKCRENSVEAQGYLERLEQIRAEEAAHVDLLSRCIASLGGDPTAVTPAADVTGVEGAGLMEVLTDPMASVMQSLRAILFAELVDNDGWDALIDLAQDLRRHDIVQQFQVARDQERVHLDTVRRWYKDAALREGEALVVRLKGAGEAEQR